MKKITAVCLSILVGFSGFINAENIIYLIGDGMSAGNITAAMNFNKKPLAIEKTTVSGLQKTHSSNSLITDSAAAGTALACGIKTNNGMLGMTPEKRIVKSLLKAAKEKGLLTGLVATKSITDATPAAFIANVENRDQQEKIAEAFLNGEIDYFVGGGEKFFNKRADKRNLLEELRKKGFSTATDLDAVLKIKKGKVAGLLADEHLTYASEKRGDMLAKTTQHALEFLQEKSKGKGFFIMIEGSQIDTAGHHNSEEEIISEILDFDKSIKIALDFAEKTPDTLVVITGDHDTGGLAIRYSKLTGKPKVDFCTLGHTGTMIPVYAFGKGATKFTGIMDNTDIAKKIAEFMKVKIGLINE